MDAETRERDRILKMRARKLRNLGRPLMVLPHEFEQARRAVRVAHAAGMSYVKMGLVVGRDRSTITDIGEGRVKSMHRTTYDLLLAMRVEPDEMSLGRTKRNVGAKVCPVGTSRRLRALTALGISSTVVAEHLGMWSSAVRMAAKSDPAYVYSAMAADVARVYDKLKDSTAQDLGVPAMHVRTNQRRAREWGWAPPECWDDDTIDDPAAVPEYTGACGTEEGYRIHIRESLAGRLLPPCAACKTVVEVVLPGRAGASGEVPFRFLHQAFADILEAKGLNPRRVAITMMGDATHADRLYRWRKGDRQPQGRAEVHRLAEVLDVEPGELMVDVDEEGERVANAIADGRFNPYVFKAVMEMAGLSQTAVARIVGITHASIGKWVRGEYAPSKRDYMQTLADQLGIDIEVFYS